MLAETTRAANREDGSASFQKLAQAGNRRCGSDASAPSTKFCGQFLLGPSGIWVFGRRLVTAGSPAAGGPCTGTLASGGNCAISENQHVEFLAQTAAIELRRKNDLKWKFELF